MRVCVIDFGCAKALPIDFCDARAACALRPMLDAMLGPESQRTVAIAEHLKIRLTERGAPRVLLTFPGRCADTLEELMPDDLRARLDTEGTNLASIVRKSAKRGHLPGVLFESHHEQQHVRVWLE